MRARTVKAEDRFLERLRALLPRGESVRIGPGDDAAVLGLAAGEVAVTTDLMVEGVDFLPGEDPEVLGRRVVSVNLSDLAAMGARPEFFLLSIAFPPPRGEDYPLAIARGAIARGQAYGASLVGGDLSSAPETFVSVCLWGRLEGAPLSRSGGSPGDLLYVSGRLGEAAAGLRLAGRLHALGRGAPDPAPELARLPAGKAEGLIRAYRDPEPRIALGRVLSGQGLASAAIDVSDGLGLDAARLARASAVRAVLEKEALPVSEALAAFAALEAVDPLELVLSGGDDYELLFAARPETAAALGRARDQWGVGVTRIGFLERGEGAVVRDEKGERDVAHLGHDHFGAGR